ncbi:hypothetical protein KA107_00625 [Candidatus Pacearchaeota archaeon]|nr:hypothetical protein [Candidatus Pacearchaeota archaeon]
MAEEKPIRFYKGKMYPLSVTYPRVSTCQGKYLGKTEDHCAVFSIPGTEEYIFASQPRTLVFRDGVIVHKYASSASISRGQKSKLREDRIEELNRLERNLK